MEVYTCYGFVKKPNRKQRTMLVNTKAEIARRENAQAAAAEINKILNKYKLSIHDVDLKPLGKKAPAKTNVRAQKLASAADKRKRVKSKHICPSSEKSWSGRGRAPLWVVEICQREGIDLHAFKLDKRFLAPKSS